MQGRCISLEQAVDYVIDTKDEDFVAKFISICTLVMGYAIISILRKPSAAHNIHGKISRYVKSSLLK